MFASRKSSYVGLKWKYPSGKSTLQYHMNITHQDDYSILLHCCYRQIIICESFRACQSP